MTTLNGFIDIDVYTSGGTKLIINGVEPGIVPEEVDGHSRFYLKDLYEAVSTSFNRAIPFTSTSCEFRIGLTSASFQLVDLNGVDILANLPNKKIWAVKIPSESLVELSLISSSNCSVDGNCSNYYFHFEGGA